MFNLDLFKKANKKKSSLNRSIARLKSHGKEDSPPKIAMLQKHSIYLESILDAYSACFRGNGELLESICEDIVKELEEVMSKCVNDGELIEPTEKMYCVVRVDRHTKDKTFLSKKDKPLTLSKACAFLSGLERNTHHRNVIEKVTSINTF